MYKQIPFDCAQKYELLLCFFLQLIHFVCCKCNPILLKSLKITFIPDELVQ